MKIITTVNGNYPGGRLTGKDRYKRLYHYTSFDTFVKIWLTKHLLFGTVTSTNDIQEADISSSITNMQQVPLAQAYRDIRTSFKQISFTMDYDTYLMGCMSPMMWGLYADKRKGVCIELDYDKIIFPKDCIKGPVKYKKVLKKNTQIPPEAKSSNDIKRYIMKNKNELFLTKQASWKGENEYRILSYNPDYLDIAEAITCVYLTSYDSLECLLVEKLVNNELPVRCMRFIDYYNISIPITSATKTIREKFITAKNDPDNALVKIESQAINHYEKLKDNPDADLTKGGYYL